MRIGSCHCERVSFDFSGEVLTCYVCHCRRCQAASGSAFSINMLVRSKDIEVVSGEPEVNQYLYNDRCLNRNQCSSCCTALWMNYSDKDEFVSVQAGTFQQQDWYQPVAHIWISSALPWLSLTDSIARYNTQPELTELIDLWQCR